MILPKESTKHYVFNRNTQTTEEEIVLDRWAMDFCYKTGLGKFLTISLLIKRPISDLVGRYMNSRFSKRRISGFIDQYGIDSTALTRPIESFASFNEFFTRQLKPDARPIDQNPGTLIAPADCRLLVLGIDDNLVIPIKGARYTLTELLDGDPVEKEFRNGMLLVCRLAPCDYHRFCYVDDGQHDEIRKIEGCYHSVHPTSLESGYCVFPMNQREYALIDSTNFGPLVQMEVGALMVGKIHQHRMSGGTCKKGEEKGWFEFGGSTVVLIIRANTIVIDKDILERSIQGMETLVRYGSAIGKTLFDTADEAGDRGSSIH